MRGAWDAPRRPGRSPGYVVALAPPAPRPSALARLLGRVLRLLGLVR